MTKYKITRRDFTNGVTMGTGAALLAPNPILAQAPGESTALTRQH